MAFELLLAEVPDFSGKSKSKMVSLFWLSWCYSAIALGSVHSESVVLVTCKPGEVIIFTLNQIA